VPLLVVELLVQSEWALTALEGSLVPAQLVLWVTVVVLGWRLQRTRVVFAATALVTVGQSFLIWNQDPLVTQAMAIGFGVTLPIVLLVMGFAGDRGLTTASGMFRVLLLFGWGCLVAWMALPEQQHFVENLADPIVQLPILQWVPLSQVALGSALLSSFALVWRFVEKRGAIESAMLGATVAGVCATVFEISESHRVLWLVGGQTILLLGLMEGFYSIAYKDELTGLPGRRALNEQLDQIEGMFTVAMVDVDHFKKFNDRYGHDAGDEVLRMVGARLDGVGGGGKAYRYGGEEFTVVFTGKSASRVQSSLEELLLAIAERPFVFRGRGRPRERPENPRPVKRPRKTVQITVSIGLADSKGGKNTAESVLKLADQALYRAKAGGRNQLAK